MILHPRLELVKVSRHKNDLRMYRIQFRSNRTDHILTKQIFQLLNGKREPLFGLVWLCGFTHKNVDLGSLH